MGCPICITKAINNNNKFAIVFKADNCRGDNTKSGFLLDSLGGGVGGALVECDPTWWFFLKGFLAGVAASQVRREG